jgi:hypothetical protein
MVQEPERDRMAAYTWRHPQHIIQEMQATPEPANLPSGLPGDAPIHSEWALWLYILKGLGILLAGTFLVVNVTYGFFELLSLLD